MINAENTVSKLLPYIFILSCLFVSGCGPKDPIESDKKLKSGIESLNKNDLDKAISELTLAIDNNKKNSSAYYYRGVAFTSKKMDKEALADFDKAIELNPEDEQAYANRGIAKGDLRQDDEALKDFNKALDLIKSNTSKELITANKDNELISLATCPPIFTDIEAENNELNEEDDIVLGPKRR